MPCPTTSKSTFPLNRYQTVYCPRTGSAAAPTAGLLHGADGAHPEKRCGLCPITLPCGPGHRRGERRKSRSCDAFGTVFHFTPVGGKSSTMPGNPGHGVIFVGTTSCHLWKPSPIQKKPCDPPGSKHNAAFSSIPAIPTEPGRPHPPISICQKPPGDGFCSGRVGENILNAYRHWAMEEKRAVLQL